MIALLTLFAICPLKLSAQNNAVFDVQSEWSDEAVLQLYQGSGPYSRFRPDQEVLAKRTETSKTFLNDDGTFTWMSMAGPAHYAEDGVLKTSSNVISAFTSPAYSAYSLANLHNKVKTLYGRNEVLMSLDQLHGSEQIKLTLGGVRGLDDDNNSLISWDYSSRAPVLTSGHLSSRNEEVIYHDILFDHLNFHVQQGSGKIKTEYILESQPGWATHEDLEYIVFEEILDFSMPVQLVRDRTRFMFSRGQETLLVIDDLYLYDEERTSGLENLDLIITELAAGKFLLQYFISLEWLNAPTRVYPVFIDPSITVTPVTSGGTFWTGTTNEDADAHSSDRMKIGFYDCSGCDDEEWATYAKFSTSGIPTLACVQSAQLELYQDVWRDGSGDNQLRFDVGWLNLDPVPSSWTSIRDGINSLAERYARWDVWGTPGACGGCNGGYDFNEGCCGWENLNVNYPLFVNRLTTTAIAQDYIAIGLDNLVGNYDCWSCLGDETNELEFPGWSSSDRPKITVNYTNLVDPANFGLNVWNVYAYEQLSGYNVNDNLNLNNLRYKGAYVDPNINIITTNFWSSDGTPSSASGFLGCPVTVDNHVVVHKRRGFPQGTYQIDLNNHDDAVRVYVNGTQVYQNDGCCADRGVIWTGTLDCNSTVEIRFTEGGGGSLLNVAFIQTSSYNPPYGTDTWHVAAYDGNNFNTYYGSYNNSTLDLNIGTHVIGPTGNPDDATGYSGCTFPSTENWSLVARRQGFTCGVYQINSIAHDDDLRIRVDANNDGSFEYDSGWYGCCNTLSGVVYTAVLNSASRVEISLREYSGDAYAHVQFNNVTTALSGGSIGVVGSASVCPGVDHGSFSNTAGASGGSSAGIANGSSTYQWESSIVSSTSGFNPISGAASDTYNPGVLGQTTWFRRKVTDKCGNVAYSNVLEITVKSNSAAPTSISASLATICPGGTSMLTVSGGSLGTGASWRWYSGSCGGTLIGTSTGATLNVSPTGTTTYFVRAEGDCGVTACSSSPVSVTVNVNTESLSPTGISGVSTICTGEATTLSVSGGALGTGATWNWFTGSCGGTSIGSGPSIVVSPTVTTTYYVRAAGACNTTSCASREVVVNTIPSLPGSGVSEWNVYSYADYSMSSFRGYYVAPQHTITGIPATLGIFGTEDWEFNTRLDGWTDLESPSFSAGYIGCPIPVDNISINARRSGFDCGFYNLYLQYYDDYTRIKIDQNGDGTFEELIEFLSSCCTTPGFIWSGYLGPESMMEIEGYELVGNFNIHLVFDKVVGATPPTVTVDVLGTPVQVCQPDGLSMGLIWSGYDGEPVVEPISLQWLEGSTPQSQTDLLTSDPLLLMPPAGLTVYTFTGGTDGTGCSVSATDDYTITAEVPPSVSTISSSDYTCNGSKFELVGAVPTVGVGSWSIVSGPGTPTFGALPSQIDLNAIPNSTVQARYTVSNGPGSVCPDQTADVTLNFLTSLATPEDPVVTCTPNPGGGAQHWASDDGEKLYFAMDPKGENMGEITIELPGSDAFESSDFFAGLDTPNGAYGGGGSNPARMPSGKPTCPDELFFEDIFEIDVQTQPSNNDPELTLYIPKAKWDAFVTNGNTWLDAEAGRRSAYVACYGGFPAATPSVSAPNPENIAITGYHGGAESSGRSLHLVSEVVTVTESEEVAYYAITFTTDRFSSFVLHGSGSGDPLPVQLVSFTGQHQDGVNLLDWATAAEINVSHFEVERSSDGSNFSKIGSIEAAGNSTATRNYQFPDRTAPAGGNYYRLRMVDLDGSFEYSNIVYLSKGQGVAISQYIQVVPNPFTDRFEVQFYQAQPGIYTVKVTDLAGRPVRELERQGDSGLISVPLDLTHEAAGSYLIQVQRQDGMRLIRRVVKSTD